MKGIDGMKIETRYIMKMIKKDPDISDFQRFSYIVLIIAIVLTILKAIGG